MDPVPIFMALLGAVFAGIGILVSFKVMGPVISQTSGWAELASKYPVTEEYRGELKRGQSATIANVSFSSCLGMGASGDYLYIYPGFPFKGLTPLQIPWKALTDAKREGRMISLQLDGKPLRISASSLSPAMIEQSFPGLPKIEKL